MRNNASIKAGIAAMVLLMIVSCGKITGTFAIKYPLEDSFRRIKGSVEIQKGSYADWVFRLDKKPGGNTSVGVILMKKELVWVDIQVQNVSVSPENAIVYGTIKDLDEGEYKIMLTDVRNNKVIDELPFTIYSDEEFE